MLHRECQDMTRVYSEYSKYVLRQSFLYFFFSWRELLGSFPGFWVTHCETSDKSVVSLSLYRYKTNVSSHIYLMNKLPLEQDPGFCFWLCHWSLQHLNTLDLSLCVYKREIKILTPQQVHLALITSCKALGDSSVWARSSWKVLWFIPVLWCISLKSGLDSALGKGLLMERQR